MTSSAQKTYTPEEAAPIVGSWCKPSWLKEKARTGEIRSTVIAGHLCFTDAQLDEIVKGGDRPARPPGAKAAATPPRRRPSVQQQPSRPVTELRPRQPRRMPRAS